MWFVRERTSQLILLPQFFELSSILFHRLFFPAFQLLLSRLGLRLPSSQLGLLMSLRPLLHDLFHLLRVGILSGEFSYEPLLPDNGYTTACTSRVFASLLPSPEYIAPSFLVVLVHISAERSVLRNGSRKRRSVTDAGTGISSRFRYSSGSMSKATRSGALI